MKAASRYWLGALLVAMLVACADDEQAAKAPDAAPPTPLAASAIVVAQRRIVHPSFEYPALVEAVQTARVRPEISAILTAIHFRPGDMVAKDQLLLELDTAQYETALDAASASLLAAQAAVKQAESNWARAEDLQPKGFISAQDYDAAKAAVDAARAAVDGAGAGLRKAELDLKHTKLTAPFAGKISKSNYAVGDLVSPSVEPLYELVQIDPIYVVSSVELQSYHKFVMFREELKDKGVEIPELQVNLKLAGGMAYDHEGQFEAWDNISNPSSGTISGRVLFPNPDALLLPGHNVTLTGETISSFERVTIPQKAVLQDQQGQYVKLLSADDTVQRANITVGIRDGADWVILDGIEEGTRVIVEGARLLREGSKVAVQ